jgi:ribosome biogenesis GTPase
MEAHARPKQFNLQSKLKSATIEFMFSSTLIDQGFDAFFQQQVDPVELSSAFPARVMNVQRSGVHLLGEDIDRYYELSASDYQSRLTVGDWVLLHATSQRLDRRLERKSCFKRRAPGTDRSEQLIAANVDTLFVVSSCNHDFNEARLERYLAIARQSQVMVVIVLTKSDLTDDPQSYVQRAARLMPGIQVDAVNALHRQNLAGLDPWLGNGQTIALLGSSGAGKSTLTNTLLGNEKIDTQAIREDDAKGRHTTTSRSMHRLAGGAWLLDTPGMRELQIADVKTGLDDVFAEISEFAGLCRFTDCQHENEPGCAIQRAISSGEIDATRLSRWRKLVREDAFNSASMAERRAHNKALGRFYKSVIKDKKTQQDR